MTFNNLLKIPKEGMHLLFKGSRKAIPFNIFLALLLCIDMAYNTAPLELIISWFTAIFFMSMVRWFFCGWVLNKEQKKLSSSLGMFLILTFIMGCVWGSCYLLAVAYMPQMHEFIIILVFGGMCAGAIASLSVWMPAYIVYILPMFLPIIFYNYYLVDLDRAILATMFLLFVLMIVITAKLNNILLNQTFALTREKESLNKELKILSITDFLTGLYNRRYFEESLIKEINRGKRNKYPLNLISIDVDNFKLLNDTFGHPYGDEFLIYIAELLQHNFARANDTVFRLGGDEFAAILVNIPMGEVKKVCQKIRDIFHEKKNAPSTNMAHEEDILKQVTLSIGIVYIPFDSSSSLSNIVIAADKALYQSKQQGKNKIILKRLT